MALQDIVNVNISLETNSVSRAGFGTPLFIGAHRWFPERVRVYTSMTGVEEDIPDGCQEHAAAQLAFSQNPAPAQVKIGRRTANVILEPDAPAEYDEYTVSVTFDNGTASQTVNASYIAGSGEDQEDVVDGLIADIENGGIVGTGVQATKVGSGSAATLKIAPATVGTNFSISGISDNLSYSTTDVTESASDVLSAIEAVDNDFYFVAAHDHTSTFVLAMAAAIETRSKIYFMSGEDTDYIASLDEPATDLFGQLKDLQYFRTVTFFYHDADTVFPEMGWIGVIAPNDPGTITCALKRIAGLSASQNPSTGNLLSATEQNNLNSRNSNFLQSVGDFAITRDGKVAANEYIDIIQSRDLLVARITEAYQNKLINAGKVPYTDSGINSMRSVLISVLSRYVSTPTQPNILQSSNPFTTSFPRAKDVSFADKSNRVLSGSFVAFLSGAIHVVTISGKLTLEASA